MRANGTAQLVAPQGNSLAHVREAEDKELVRRCFREAVEESGVKKEAIAAEMTRAGCKTDAPYLSKLLSGEKPITVRQIRALPDDVEAIFARKYAEAFGHYVVTPCDTQEEANLCLVRGMLPPRLPRRAERMARCELPDGETSR